jgi:hypothetical protein
LYIHFFASIIVALSASSSSLSAIWTEKHYAFGDGLAQEQISSSLGNRKADLLIKMKPPVITNETIQMGQNPIMEFRLFDSNTNKSFSHVTYYITIEKDGKTLLSNWFHAHDGNLGIRIKPNYASRVACYRNKDIFYVLLLLLLLFRYLSAYFAFGIRLCMNVGVCLTIIYQLD